ncbi:MAG: hypothetical protein OXU96_05575, partial [Gammaproteobacteria bacterium]|nr:hypothetical protein [Gammaproteobacteria bacterium]
CVKHAASVQSEPGSNSPDEIKCPAKDEDNLSENQHLTASILNWMRDSGESKRPHNLLDLVVKEPGQPWISHPRGAEYTRKICPSTLFSHFFDWFLPGRLPAREICSAQRPQNAGAFMLT